MKLFEIVGEFQSLYDLLTEDTDPQIIADTLESLTAELETKSAGYVAVRNQIDMEYKKAAELEKKYKEIKKARENAKKAMDERLLIASGGRLHYQAQKERRASSTCYRRRSPGRVHKDHH